ncbi:MAG: phenylacetate--CoA ligase [Verrucomicrobiales bacterium]|nr:phenylacetate--CoA ligase [Verrucomicrobiales bacterium]
MYWQAEIETMPRPELEALQLRRLQEVVRRVATTVPFYRQALAEAGVSPDDIRSLADARRLPFTTNADLRANYPDGLLAIPRQQVTRLHTSSGTTGKPKALFFSRRDVDQAAELIARCLVMTGCTAEDVLQNMMTYGLFTGALVLHYGAEKVGMLVIPAGPGNSERQLMLMQDFRTTVFHTTPSYALYLAEFIRKRGLDPRKDLALRKGLVGAEAHSEETRRKIEEALGIDAYNSYGLSEMNGPGVAFECEHKSGLHLWEDQYLLEIIDPVTGVPLADGERGELVLTSLTREAMPLLRYRTRDLTSVIPAPCPCGRTHRRLARITGRSDDMLVVRGVNLYPQQIERVLMSIPELGSNYLIHLRGLDELTVKVEFAASGFDGRVENLVRLEERVVEKLRAEILVKPKVELSAPGTLPVSEGKAKRVVDERVL